MAKKGTRKVARKGKNSERFTRYTSRVYSPFGHALNAAGNSVRELSYYVGNVASRSVKGVKKLGNIWTNHTNMAIRNLRQKGGKRKGTRKGRKASRKGTRKASK